MNNNKLKDIISRVLHKWGQKHTDLLKQNLDKINKVDTGTLMDSIQFQVGTVTLTIQMAEYAQYVHDGRRPGKFPPVDAIRAWVERKGLTITGSNRPLAEQQRSLTYLIGRKIANEGIEASPFLEALPIDEIMDELQEEITKWAISKITNLWQ